MATQLILLCSSATASSRVGAFPHPDEPLDQGGLNKARVRLITPPPDLALRSPARAAQETAAAMGFDANVDDRLADIDFGSWAARSFAEVQADETQAFATWIAQPERGTPSGESLSEVRRRLRPWLSTMEREGRRILVVTHASVIRAILSDAIDLPESSAMRFDIAPLSAVRLSFNRQWRLQELSGG